MKRSFAILLTALVVGCSGTGLPYRPVDGTSSVSMSASHTLTSDRLYVELATEGFRVESAVLVLADGTELTGELHHPSRPLVGASADSFDMTGTGVINRPTIGSSASGVDTTAAGSYGHTVAIFPAAKAGSGPWRVRVKLLSYAPVDIELPALQAQPAAQLPVK